MARFAPYLLVTVLSLLLSSLISPPTRMVEASTAAREAGIRALGAARGYASTALWLRAGDSYRRGDLYETTATYQLIRELQPRNPAVYSYLAWNQAYNIAGQFREPDQRAGWLARGFDTLRQGQRALPADAGLLLDEWSFVLNRGIGMPVEVLAIEDAAWGEANRAWANVVKHAIELRDRLSAADRAQLQQFLENVGLHPLLFHPDVEYPDLAATYGQALAGLSEDNVRLLLHCDWCRFHLMTLVLEPALRLGYRPLSLDQALLNSYRYAIKSMLPGSEQEFEPQYRQGVATAFRAGIDNARRYGGQGAVGDFVAHVRENFSDLPGWLPE